MKQLDLTGEWTLIGNKQQTSKLPAQVPGDTHSALLAAGIIDDPYWATNELDIQWLAQEDWTYQRDFDLPAEWLEEASLVLHCDSLDTIATLELNGRRCGRSDNMFRQQAYEVKRYLKAGRNTLRIRFKSAERHALLQARRLPYPIPHTHHPVQSPHRNLVRKVQCHSGWDWGPCLMVSGIYGDIALSATSGGRIEHVATRQTHRPKSVQIEVEIAVKAARSGTHPLVVTLGESRHEEEVRLRQGANTFTVLMTVDEPQLWWPAGYGEHPLYPLTISVAGDDYRTRLGLRTIELVSEEDDIGRSFLFRVNGTDIYCKGANWIPADSLPQRQTDATIDDLLQSARDANMNMIRVWGGGQYESDHFYDRCDELGLLVWQDFMFACSAYPATKDFLTSVREEAICQVRRLRNHASLALWCGNNENVGALTWFEETRQHRDRYVIDYDRLTEGVLGQVVDEHDPARAFWPSSPCGGRGDYSDCWHDDSRGDMHYWDVWHRGRSFDAYQQIAPRFCSEFGYQSFPSLDVIRSYAPGDQLNLTSPVMEHHQKHRRGNSNIIEMFSRYFRLPEGFEQMIYLSQVQQALAIRTAVEHWRRLRPVCMGTLFWQLNDCWPVASWSSLNYGGSWKLLHYLAKRFYEPLMLTPYETDQGYLEIWGVNDHLEKRDVEVTLRIMDFTGDLHSRDSFHAVLPAEDSKRLKRLRIADLAPAPDDVFAIISYEGDGRRTDREHFFSPWKRCPLDTADIELECQREGDQILIHAATDKPAFYVKLEAAGISGTFEDNGFLLLPGERRHLHFTPKQKVRIDQFRKALTCTHLRQTYR